MPEAEVLYSDIKFTRKKGDTTEAACSSADTTYSEVKILKTQPSSELPGCQSRNNEASQQVESNGGSNVKSQKIPLLILCVLLAFVVIALCYVLYDNMQNKEELQKLRKEHKDMKTNFTETLSRKMAPPSCPKCPEIKANDSCPKCDKGWEQFGGKCYYFSTNYSSWEESRRLCQSHRGDLVKIDSKDEQKFLMNTLSAKMSYPEDKFWIGLTDSKQEGKWFWVDDSPLNERTKSRTIGKEKKEKILKERTV